MGTRSRIGVMHGDNCKSVYCHWDGYLEHNGSLLHKHYDSARANHIVALGDLSSLGSVIGEVHPFGYHGTDMSAEEYNKKFSGMCTFYGRDRGEEGTEFKTDASFEEFFARAEGCDAEWYYVMRDGTWYVGNTYSSDSKFYKNLVLLSEAMAAIAEQEVA